MRKTSPSPAPATPDREYTIDELARATDMTVHNVRAYQDRGLLGPPRRRGRAGVYDDTHAERLRLIQCLLARGHTLANIMDLITVVDEGNDLRRALGLEPAGDAARVAHARIACRSCIRDARDAQIRRPLHPTFDIHIDIRL